MTAANMPACMREIFRWEGGYVNDRHDPGGATNMGITIGTLSDALGRPATIAEIRGLSKVEASSLYRRRYWLPVQGDTLPDGVDLAVFDHAVNSGPGRAVKTLQGALGVSADGVIGPATMSAVRKADPGALIDEVCDLRLAQLRRLDNWQYFGKGWTNRVEGIRAAAKLLCVKAPSVNNNAPSPGNITHTEIPPAPNWLARLIASISAMFRRP